ncbi:MAG: bifunctional DNA-formamidopyrimidine glycosylase/DNA-(apurinic or apyrimidinic site) lyase [Acidobacteria bacterium]|nr:bifunctional DNA-formamidopyrimidine glycosylase/DNA-(apurinic or apyrimidinic site) lyase [Acidobacteriota bacterium]
MPELPEVETVANGVDARVRGQRIERVWTSGKPQTFKSSEAEIAEALTGARIERVHRVGKTVVMDLRREGREMQIPFGNDSQESKDGSRGGVGQSMAGQPASRQFLVHLGMTGRLLVSQPEVPLPLHTHAVLSLGDGREVRFVDARRFGRLSVVREAGGYAGPGEEPTTIGAEAFGALFKGRKLAIKAALLNQSIVHGVGNIYADESLFRAGIRPRKQAERLTKAELAGLHAALQQVLAHAIELGGSSVSDYVDADGVRGFFQLEHKVYGRAGALCLNCGSALKKIVVGGRTTVYCPRCQR